MKIKIALFLLIYFVSLFKVVDIHPIHIKYEEAVVVREAKEVKINKQELKCLTDNIHYEAAGEGIEGMKAVAAVVMNRLRDPRWPSTICKIVYQPFQFSWTTSGPGARLKPPDAQDVASLLASQVLAAWDGGRHGSRADVTLAQVLGPVYLTQAMFFHANWLKRYPYWSKSFIVVTRVGNHIFYRDRKDDSTKTAGPIPKSSEGRRRSIS